METSQKQQAFWQSYTKEKISDDDIIEINKNLYDFAKVLVEIQKIFIRRINE